MAGILRLAMAGSRQLISRNIRITLEQLIERSLKTCEARRIDAVRQVKSDRPNGSLVSDAKTNGVNHVVEIPQIALACAEGDATKVVINVSRVVEDDSVDVIAEQGESKFESVEQQGVAA